MTRSLSLVLAALSLAAAPAVLVACEGDTETTPKDGPGASTDAHVRAAVALGSCIPDDGVGRFLEGLYYDALFPLAARDKAFNAKIACFATTQAEGCAAVEECLGLKADLTGPCEESCNGSVWTGCDDSLKFTADCGKLGLQCNAEEICVAEEPVACDFETFEPTCEGDVPVNCSGEVSKGGSCGELGLACVVGTEADLGLDLAYCKGQGAACEQKPDANGTTGNFPFAQGIACEGANLRACVSGGEHVYDCAEVGPGFSCQAPAGGMPFCGLAAECDPFENNEASCDGTKITFCNAGKRDSIDCVELGFTGCEEPEFARGAVCVPSIYSEAG